MSNPTETTEPVDRLTTLRAHRDEIVDAIASGVRSVKSQAGEEIHYRGVREMKAALSVIESQIQDLEKRRPRFIRVRPKRSL